MSKGIENLSSQEYPGRIVILGQDQSGQNSVVIYGITGRSPSSQARKLEHSQDTIWVKPTDKSLLEKGNIDLLIYPSVFCLPHGIAVSNGKQTVDVMACLGQGESAAEVLAFALKNWDYEPDVPAYTPRISGCVLPNKNAGLSIIKRAPNGEALRNVYEFTLVPGEGKMIMTYQGTNRDPLPSFSGEPLDLEIKASSPNEAARCVYEALEPKDKNKDFRVAVACVFSPDILSKDFHIHIINRFDEDTDENGKNR
jgi:IMP cyclohydrolase